MEGPSSRHAAKGRLWPYTSKPQQTPQNGMVDLERSRKIVSGLRAPDGARPLIIVENTMLGRIYQAPLAHGAELIGTSSTKCVGGDSDLTAGGGAGTAAILVPMRGMR